MRFLLVVPCLLILPSLFVACSSSSVHSPDTSDVKVSRQAPDKNCKDLGTVNGRVKSISGSFEDAIRDMQLDAARMGGNYVQMGATGGMSQSVNGRAFRCD